MYVYLPINKKQNAKRTHTNRKRQKAQNVTSLYYLAYLKTNGCKCHQQGCPKQLLSTSSSYQQAIKQLYNFKKILTSVRNPVDHIFVPDTQCLNQMTAHSEFSFYC